MKKVVYLFPGQGSQYVGMGKDLYDNYPEAREVFDKADSLLPEAGIRRLCFEGPMEELTLTANSQVCILVTSIAAYAALSSWLIASATADRHGKKQNLDVVACAGLSLGELTSLVAAEAISFEDAVRLVRRRGELMDEASRRNPGAMASIIGLSLDEVKTVCSDSGAEIANLNCPGQIVISGTQEAVDKGMKISTEKGAKRAIALNVSGAFHCSLMKYAADLFAEELKKVDFSEPDTGVVSNVTADFEKTPEEIKENLVKQLCSSVRWEESIKKIAAAGVTEFFEIGPGKVIRGLLRRIDKTYKVHNIEKSEDIKSLTI